MKQRKKQVEKLLENIQTLRRKIFFCNLKEGRITASQWFVLQYLYKSESATLKQVAQGLGITSSAATQLVEGLVRKGYITRKTSVDDRRELKLMLSNSTKKHMENLRKKRILAMVHVFDILTDQEFRSYYNLCDKIAGSLIGENKNKP